MSDVRGPDDAVPDDALPDDATAVEVALPDADEQAVLVGIDRRTGSVLRVIAVVGVVVSVVMSVVAWQFLGDLERNVDQSLRIGEDAAETLSETIDLAATVIATVESGVITLDDLVVAVDRGLVDATGIATSTAELSTTLAASLDDVDTALSQVESLAGTIDGALRALSQVPFGPDYDPAVSYPDAISDLRVALEPLDASLRDVAGRLDEFSASSDAAASSLGGLRTDLDEARDALAESDRLLDRYRVTAEEAGVLAAQSRDDLESSMWWARVTAVVVGVWLVAAQYLPWWLGSRSRSVVRGRTRARRVRDRAAGGTARG